MNHSIDRRALLATGATLAAGAILPAWAQAPPTLRFAAVFSDKDIRAEMMKMFAKDIESDLQGRDAPELHAVPPGHRAGRPAARQPRDGQHRAAGHLQAGARLVAADLGLPVPRRQPPEQLLRQRRWARR
jgi:hypothetical protein